MEPRVQVLLLWCLRCLVLASQLSRWSVRPWSSNAYAARSERLRINPQDQPLMLAEPSFQPREARERMVTRVFEGCSAPALFLARNAALSSYATGRQTSLVVDMGYEGTIGARRPLLPQHFPARTCDNSLHFTWLTNRCTHTVPSHKASELPSRTVIHTQHGTSTTRTALKSAAFQLRASAAVSATSAGCPRWL